MMYLPVPHAVFQVEHGFLNCSKTKSTSENEVMKPISDRKSALKIHLRRYQRRKEPHDSLAGLSAPPSSKMCTEKLHQVRCANMYHMHKDWIS